MRTRAGYWIGGALVIAGVAGAIAWLAVSFLRAIDKVDGFQRVSAPGTATMLLDARKYVVYFDGPGADADDPPIAVTISDARRDELLPIAPYSTSLTYSFPDHEGVARGTVTPPRAGRYVVTARTGAPRSAGYAVALGESVFGGIVWTIAGTLGIGALLGLSGIGLIIATAIRRG